MKWRRLIIAQHIVLIALMLIVSCEKYNYVDALQGIGRRVEVLEGMELEVNEALDGQSITFTLRDGRTFTVPIG